MQILRSYTFVVVLGGLGSFIAITDDAGPLGSKFVNAPQHTVGQALASIDKWWSDEEA